MNSTTDIIGGALATNLMIDATIDAILNKLMGNMLELTLQVGVDIYHMLLYCH